MPEHSSGRRTDKQAPVRMFDGNHRHRVRSNGFPGTDVGPQVHT